MRVVTYPTALARVLLQPGSGGGTGLESFVALTAVVITGFLALARLSQRAVDPDDPPALPAGTGTGTATGESTAFPRDGGDDTPRGGVGETPRDGGDDTPRGGVGETPRDGGDGSATDVGGTGRGMDANPNGPTPAVARSRDTTAGDERGVELSPGALLANVALTQGLFGALLAGGAVYLAVPADALGVAADPLSTGLPALAVGVGAGLALWVGNELAAGLADTAGAEYDEGLRKLLAPADAGGWLLLLGATLPVIAVVEEFIFRAAAVGAAAAAVPASPWALAVVSSAAFALGHGAQGRVGIVVTGGLGFALAALFVVTNSLLAVVVAHYLVNALEFAVHEGLGLSDPVWG